MGQVIIPDTLNSIIVAQDQRIKKLERTLYYLQNNLVTALPSSPIDGQEIRYVVDSTNGIIWNFKYRSASASTYKWEFIGGSPLFAQIAADQGTTSTSYVNLATTGPSVILPLAGDYDYELGCGSYSTGASGVTNYMSADFGSGASDADGAMWQQSSTTGPPAYMIFRSGKKTGLSAVTVTCKYRSGSAGGANFGFIARWIKMWPSRVG